MGRLVSQCTCSQYYKGSNSYMPMRYPVALEACVPLGQWGQQLAAAPGSLKSGGSPHTPGPIKVMLSGSHNSSGLHNPRTAGEVIGKCLRLFCSPWMAGEQWLAPVPGSLSSRSGLSSPGTVGTATDEYSPPVHAPQMMGAATGTCFQFSLWWKWPMPTFEAHNGSDS